MDAAPGEGAFYGPKLEFSLRDRLGRSWQCGTIELDLVLAERFDESYVAADGARRRPVILHRAVLGSLERFLGIVLEHAGHALPPWLAPGLSSRRWVRATPTVRARSSAPSPPATCTLAARCEIPRQQMP